MGSGKYRVWGKEELAALRIGVARHGAGNWEKIRTDPELSSVLQGRSGIQVKDKWRNLVKFKHVSKDEVEACTRVRAKPPPRKSATASSLNQSSAYGTTSSTLRTSTISRTTAGAFPLVAGSSGRGSQAGSFAASAGLTRHDDSRRLAETLPASSGAPRTRRPVKASRTAPNMREMLAGTLSGGFQLGGANPSDTSAGGQASFVLQAPPPITTGHLQHRPPQLQPQPPSEFDVMIDTDESLRKLKMALIGEDSPRPYDTSLTGFEALTSRSGSGSMGVCATHPSFWWHGHVDWTDHTHQRTVTSNTAAVQSIGVPVQLPEEPTSNHVALQWNENNMKRVNDLGDIHFSDRQTAGNMCTQVVPNGLVPGAALQPMNGAYPGAEGYAQVGHQGMDTDVLMQLPSFPSMDDCFRDVLFTPSFMGDHMPYEQTAATHGRGIGPSQDGQNWDAAISGIMGTSSAPHSMMYFGGQAPQRQ